MVRASDQRLFVLPGLPLPEGMPQRELHAFGHISAWQQTTGDGGDEIRIVLKVDSAVWREVQRPSGGVADDVDPD